MIRVGDIFLSVVETSAQSVTVLGDLLRAHSLCRGSVDDRTRKYKQHGRPCSEAQGKGHWGTQRTKQPALPRVMDEED